MGGRQRVGGLATLAQHAGNPAGELGSAVAVAGQVAAQGRRPASRAAQRNGQVQAEQRAGLAALVTAGKAFVVAAQALRGNGVTDVAPLVAVADGEVDRPPAAAPVALRGAVQVQVAAVAQLLADVGVETVAQARERLQRLASLYPVLHEGRVAQAEIATGGVTIGEQRKVGAGVRQVLAVGETVAGAAKAVVAGNLGTRQRHVTGESAHRRSAPRPSTRTCSCR